MSQHRIIRRGIPFGEPFDPALGKEHGPDAERGLVFACYQASVPEQFSFLQSNWVNNAAFPQAGTGPDPVIGPSGTCPFNQGTSSIPLNVGHFVTVEGSLYAFTPSIPCLQAIAGGATLPVFQGDQPLDGTS